MAGSSAQPPEGPVHPPCSLQPPLAPPAGLQWLGYRVALPADLKLQSGRL